MIFSKRTYGLMVGVCLLFAGAFFVSGQFTSSAANEDVWISIDHTELEIVLAEIQSGKFDFDIEVATVNGGIAVAKISKQGLEMLSAEMHEKFHKCAGFMLHTDENEAFSSIERTLSANTDERFVSYTIDNQANVNQLLPEVTELKVRQTIMDLSSYDTRRHNQPSGLASAGYIKHQWELLAASRSDMSVAYFDNTTFGSRATPQPSVILTVQGTTLPSEVVVLGAHQDSIRSGSQTANAPGADDDASGIASITEAIRVMVEKDYYPNRTVHFMAYAAEEVGLWGSNNIAATYLANQINVVGVIQMDMTGFKGSPTIDIGMVTDFTNAAQNQFVRDLATEYLPTLTVVNTTCGYACSDHAPWTSNGFPASFPHESNLANSNSALHTANDTLAQIGGNANHALKFSKLALAFIGELAKGSIAAAPSSAKFDFDGDSKTDISIFRPAAGQWWYRRSSDSVVPAFQFGTGTDIPVPADFAGDGKTNAAFFRPSTGQWFVLNSDGSGFYGFPFGAAGDIPAPGDFDGDGKADAAVFRPSNATWYILRSSDQQTQFVGFGSNGDQPLVGDYDNDGSDDVAIYRPSLSQFWILRSTAGLAAYQFGAVGDKAMTADFSGDGSDDIALFRPSTAFWYVLRSEDQGFYGFPFGANGDLPAPGDYDGDGAADVTVFRPSANTWFSLQSTAGTVITGFGSGGDAPVPGSYVR